MGLVKNRLDDGCDFDFDFDSGSLRLALRAGRLMKSLTQNEFRFGGLVSALAVEIGSRLTIRRPYDS